MTRRIQNFLRATITAMLLGALAILGATPALALDKVTLNDGTVLEGKITREMEDGTVFFTIVVGELEQPRVILASDIASIQRDAEMQREAAQQKPEANAKTIPDGATKVAFITLEEMVGLYFTLNSLKESVSILEELPEAEQPDIIVLWINSGGGATNEMRRMVRYIHNELKEDYRVVAWVKSAISAAAMTSWVCEEIYMMPQAGLGGNTQFTQGPSGTKASEGVVLEEVLIFMEDVSDWGRRHPYVMRAMQVYTDLSCDIDEDGRVNWRLDLEGEHKVSNKDRILTLDAHQAAKYGVVQGIAQTKDELAKAMGLTEWVEVGYEADEYMQQFRKDVKIADVRVGELDRKINLALSAAESAPNAREYDRQIAMALRYLREMRSLVRRAHSLEFMYGLTDEYFRQREQRIRDMSRGGSRGGGSGGSSL